MIFQKKLLKQYKQSVERNKPKVNQYYKKDLYKILEIPPESDISRIKAAYRKQARIWHPDVNDNSKESIIRFKEITEAYEVLTDSQKRSQYDILKGFNTRNTKSYDYTERKTREQSAKKAYTETNTKQKTQNQTEQQKTTTEKQKQQENKGSFSQVFENILDGIFTSGNTPTTKNKHTQTKKEKSTNGRDINLNITIKIEETITGTNRTINVLHSEQCPKCQGRRFINGEKCTMCKGTGEVSIHKKLNIKIPANVKQGTKIRIQGEGNKGSNGGKNGDLYLLIDIEDNKTFKFDGLNVLLDLPISPYEAALGANIEVQTLCGNISMKIPPNTTTDQKFRLSGQGIYDEKKKQKGDQIVTVKIEIPKTLSQKEIELYTQLKNISTHNVRENFTNDKN